MRNIVISIISTIILIVLALFLIPAFLSTDYLKTQVVQLVKDQSGMTLAIDGDVSLSFITGIKLTTEQVSLKDAQNKALFSVRNLDFALALPPLLKGKADITGITLDQPVITLNQGASQEGSQTTGSEQAASAGGTSTATETSASTDNINLSALSIRRLTINNGQLISVDEGGHATALFSGLDATVRIPDFNGASELEATLPYHDRTLSITANLANTANAINGTPTRVDLNIDSDLLKTKLIGSLSLKGEQIFVANYASNIGNVTQFMSWIGAPADILDVSSASIEGSVVATKDEISLPSLALSLDKQKIAAAARLFTKSKGGLPLVRVAIDSSVLDLDEIVKPQTTPTKTSDNASTTNSKSPKAKSAPPLDLSALQDFNATLDFRSGRITYQGQSLRQIKLLAHVINGMVNIDLRSANLAKGNLRAKFSGDTNKQLWSGNVNAHELDAVETAKLAGQSSPLSGEISADINFASQGLTLDEIAKRGNLAGKLTLQKGRYSNPALEAAIPNRKTGDVTNISSSITIANLDDPITIAGGFQWNGEAIRYNSEIGLADLLANAPVPASLSVQSKLWALALAGRINPENSTLSGSKLTIKTASSKKLLAWLGRDVTSGTPDLPVFFSGLVNIGTNKASLDQMSLQMGQTKGAGSLTYIAGTIPSVSGKLDFSMLDATPFLGDGQKQGRTAGGSVASAKGAQAGWDQSPIDFSGLKTIKADLAFSAKSLVARDIVIGPVDLAVKVDNGQLSTTLSKMGLYSGQGSGSVTVDANAVPAKMGARFSLANLNMKPFLTDTIGMRYLSGKGGVSLDLTAQGTSQADIIKHLNGTSKLQINDGQINGINIPQMLRSLQGNILDGWASSEEQSTDFSALTASFDFKNGIANNNDLTMLSPLLRLTGEGTINLPAMTVNYKATPKVIAKLKGQGGPVNADGVPIPIIIKGKLTQPRIYPDIPGILENPQAILNSLNQMGETGKAASKAIDKIGKNVTKEIQKQSDKLGIDLNQIIQGQTGNKQNNNSKQQPQINEQLFKNITKGLFGN